MPEEQSTITTPAPTTPSPASSTPAEPNGPSSATPLDTPPTENADAVPPLIPEDADIRAEVVSKISEAQNVLVALSSDPSVDEMSAAIGLSLYLDKLGKRATAIYSGSTPNALEFLNPEETFEPSVDALQDFVIALNKEKADHLRYKLDGDYVKIYITPYHSRISEEDLDFSYGDFNVDLVLALDVVNGIDLDSALREHGRIMHNAVIINITTGNPGKFGEIEWSDKTASSVSEMIARLLYNTNSKAKIEKEEATAFLTGIVAATNRFSNAKTTPGTMSIASRLMESGANQQLISKNITPDVENEMFSLLNLSDETPKRETDPTKLDIEHGDEPINEEETKEVDAEVNEKESTLLDDLKAAEESLAQTGAETTPDTSNQPVKLEELSDDLPETPASEPFTDSPELASEPSIGIIPEPASEPASEIASEPTPELPSEPEPALESSLPPVAEPKTPSDDSAASDNVTHSEEEQKSEKVLQPSSEFGSALPEDSVEKYGKMLEDALENTNPFVATQEAPINNPATAIAPEVTSNPEINGVPEINYMPMPGEEVLPPPPTPPIDSVAPTETANFSSPINPIEPAAPAVEPTPTYLGPQPSMQDQVYRPQASDPSAFKIPGM